MPYLLDSQVLVAVNAQERTKARYAALGTESGWELVKVWRTGGTLAGEEEGVSRHYESRLAEEDK